MSKILGCKAEKLNDAIYITEMKGLIKRHSRADSFSVSNPGLIIRDVGDIGDVVAEGLGPQPLFYSAHNAAGTNS